MGRIRSIAIALALSVAVTGSDVAAQEADGDIEELLAQLADSETADWQRVEDQIRRIWSKSGSAAMDLLLQRGQEALEADDHLAALDHLDALIDHAPDFAEGYNARATVQFARKRYGLAVNDIRRALELNPRHFGALTGLGIIMEDLGYEGDALKAFREAHRFNPHREDVSEAIRRLERRVDGIDI